MTLFENPEVTFQDKCLTLHNSSGPKCKFSYCDPSLVVRPPEGKNVQLPTEDVQFRLSKNDFESSMKASAILQYPEIAIEGDKNVISIMVVDSKNKMSDVYSLPVGETDKEFKFIFKVENFSKLMAKDYMVKLSQKGLSNFESSDKSISIRSVLLASQAIGTSKISNLLESEDVFNTLKTIKKLGINYTKKKNTNKNYA